MRARARARARGEDLGLPLPRALGHAARVTREDELTTATWVTTAGAGDAVHVRSCKLEVVEGPDRGLVRTFAVPSLRIGRSGADLVLADKLVSALHAELALEEDGYRLRDLGSTNGTFVRGVRVLDAFVEPGTEIAVGDTIVRFSALGTSSSVPLWNETSFEAMVGRSTPMRRLFAEVDRIAATDTTVLVTG